MWPIKKIRSYVEKTDETEIISGLTNTKGYHEVVL